MSKAIVEIIQNTYEQKKQKNPSYSIRAFANWLEIDHTVLYRILKKQRAIKFELADKILNRIGIEASQKNSLLLSLSSETNYTTPLSTKDIKNIPRELQSSIADEYLFAVYVILDPLNPIEKTVEAIAKYFKISETRVQNLIDSLLKSGLIIETSNGYEMSHKHITLIDLFSKEKTLQHHKAHIQLALDHISENSSLNDYSGTTITIPKEKASEAIRRIKDFRRSLTAWLTDDRVDSKSEVYRLNIQFFSMNK